MEGIVSIFGYIFKKLYNGMIHGYIVALKQHMSSYFYGIARLHARALCGFSLVQ